ncbi:MAG: HAD family hydrolase [Eubacteriales bacterium]|nr:HAD family hydrolase [Eubacteriales bacterium]
MKKYKYIIWDWNGTLFDDVEISVDTMNKMLEKTGYKNRIDLDLYKEIFTFPVSDYYQKAGFDFSKDKFEDLAKIYVEVYTSLQFTASLNEEAVSTLEFVKKRGYKQIIVSACEKNRLLNQVEKFNVKGYFDAVLGIDDDLAVSKASIAKKWFDDNNINKDEVLFIGDTVHDYEVSQSIACDCVLVSCGHQSKSVLEKTNVPILDKLSQIPDFLAL